MIPLSKDAVIRWTDPEDGTEFEFRQVVGKVELDIFEATSKLGADPTPFLGRATELVDKEHAGKSWEKGEREKAIRDRAIRLSSESKGFAFDRSETEAMYRVVDSCTIACTPKGGERIVFNNDASNSFNLTNNSQLFSAIMNTTKLSEEDKKN